MSHVLAGIAGTPRSAASSSSRSASLILLGSVYLLLPPTSAPRLGLLVALAALFGWMTIMGSIWWCTQVAGIPRGMKGTPPHWRVLDVNVGD